jgi:hypothetical protein
VPYLKNRSHVKLEILSANSRFIYTNMEQPVARMFLCWRHKNAGEEQHSEVIKNKEVKVCRYCSSVVSRSCWWSLKFATLFTLSWNWLYQYWRFLSRLQSLHAFNNHQTARIPSVFTINCSVTMKKLWKKLPQTSETLQMLGTMFRKMFLIHHTVQIKNG